MKEIKNENAKTLVSIIDPVIESEASACHDPDVIEAVQNLRLLDDILFAEVTKDIGCVQLILRVILGNKDLIVTDCRSQEKLNFFDNRSVILDCLATDKTGTKYNIEILQSSDSANPLMARCHASVLAMNDLARKQNFKDLHKTYVIIIAEHDYLKSGEPIYHINRTVRESGEVFGDEESILLINGEYSGENLIGQLMADFRATNSEEMHFEELRVRTKKIKDKGENVIMPMTMEKYGDKRAAEGRAEGVAEGRAEGVAEGRAEKVKEILSDIIPLYKNGNLPLSVACKMAEMNAVDFQALVSNN